MGLLDKFIASNSKPAAPVNNNNASGNQDPKQSNNQPAPTGNMPSNNQNTQGTNNQPNPLDVYHEMLDNASKANKEAPPSFNLPQESLDKVVSGMKFTQSIPKELMEKATGGDASALIEIMEHVGRSAYSSALQHGSALTDKFVSQRSEYDQRGIGSRVKSELTSQELSNDPNSSHPLVRKELTRIAEQLAQANPDASPAEIAEAAKDYVRRTYSALNPKSNESADPQTAKEVDWNNYFNNEQS